MNVLVACEESQRVCLAFRERGHNAYSYDEYYQKSTCLWLKGLPKLVPSNTLDDIGLTFHEWETSSGKKKRQSQWYYQTRCLPHELRAVLASKTPFGLSRAMAEQWG